MPLRSRQAADEAQTLRFPHRSLFALLHPEFRDFSHGLLGFRTIFAYWPQFDLLITGAVNSRPPNGEDKFGPTVIGGTFTALQQAHLIETAESPAAK